MKYLISGATGFIGCNLIKKLLNDGNNVIAIARCNSNISDEMRALTEDNIFIFDNNIDQLDEFLDRHKPDIFIHLAALYITQHSKNDVERLITANITYPAILFESVIRSGCNKIINTGTSWQSFNNISNNPASLYSATKEAIESILNFYVSSAKASAITLRLFDTYGPNDNRKKLISMLVESFSTNSQVEMSEGEQEIDLVYIDDVLNAYLIAAEILKNSKPYKHMIYGISSNNPITLKELVEIINATLNKKPNIAWGVKPYREREVMKTWKSFERLPGWEPKIGLKEGLKTLLR